MDGDGVKERIIVTLHEAVRHLGSVDDRGIHRYGLTNHNRHRRRAGDGRPYRRPVREAKKVVRGKDGNTFVYVRYRNAIGAAVNPPESLPLPVHVLIYCPSCGVKQDLIAPSPPSVSGVASIEEVVKRVLSPLPQPS